MGGRKKRKDKRMVRRKLKSTQRVQRCVVRQSAEDNVVVTRNSTQRRERRNIFENIMGGDI